MKKTLLLIAVATLVAAAPVLADNVIFEWAGDVTQSGHTVTAKASTVVPFNPTTNEIVVKVAGKTCTLVSSKVAIGNKGCNYALMIGPDGNLKGEARDSNSGCTQNVTAACK